MAVINIGGSKYADFWKKIAKKRESKVKILEITFCSFKIVRKWFGVTSNEVLLAFEVKTRFRFFSEELETKQYQTPIFFLYSEICVF